MQQAAQQVLYCLLLFLPLSFHLCFSSASDPLLSIFGLDIPLQIVGEYFRSVMHRLAAHTYRTEYTQRETHTYSQYLLEPTNHRGCWENM